MEGGLSVGRLASLTSLFLWFSVAFVISGSALAVRVDIRSNFCHVYFASTDINRSLMWTHALFIKTILLFHYL